MKKIVFTYNADSGFFNSLKDTVHKVVAPDSYDCNLCQVTFGAFSMNDDWKEFIENLSLEVEFLHKNEFVKRYGARKESFPNAYVDDNGRLSLFISSDEINKTKSIFELKKLVKEKLSELVRS